MKLRSLRLHGFKSFADRTEVQFHDGITAIVGPNGCGKSNISDAIRWVLGEQRPTAIRGVRMEEAIFQGTVGRRPVNRGSVVMVVSNERGALPVPFEEVEIGRTVYRDGGSDYSINRASCRLRDVHDLCRDTGLGANAYSVIEGRMVDAILSERADERRGLFEEAAGIGKYKDRRRTALRGLERAEVDLQRLEDVLGEVQTKVRSLSRQKGKAERYHELRERRLSLEVGRARSRLEELGGRLEELRRALEGSTDAGPGVTAELRTAESHLESLRLRSVETEKARSTVAERVAELRDSVVQWERDLAVATERSTAATARLARISEESGELEARRSELDAEAAGLEGDETQLAARGEALGVREEESRAALDELRTRLAEARELAEKVETREREVARRCAQLEGDEAAALDQAEELERRLAQLGIELGEASTSLEDLRSQGDLFADRLSAVAADVEKIRIALAEADSAVQSARKSWDEARAEEMVLAERVGSMKARLEALERLERDREGTEPAVRALLGSGRDEVLGILADFLSGPADAVRAVERHLGPMARAVLVSDRSAVKELARWFTEDWEGGGGLILLPAREAPEPRHATASNPESRLGLDFRAEGAAWLRHLLDRVELADGTAVVPSPDGRDRISPEGVSVRGDGAVFVGNPLGSRGLLERKEEIRSLQGEFEAGQVELERATRSVSGFGAALAEAETRLEHARQRLREAEDAHREARSEESARSDHRERMDRRREELGHQLDSVTAARERTLLRAREARAELTALAAEDASITEARRDAGQGLERVRTEWEAARSHEAEVAVERTRLEGEEAALAQRRARIHEGLESIRARVGSLEREERALRSATTDAAELQARGEGEMQRLFQERDGVQEEFRARDQALEEVREALEVAERRVRALRLQEREATERRHTLELEAREVGGALDRIRERLEGEWGRPLESLLNDVPPIEGEPDELTNELKEVVAALERLGPVNMLAVEEHEEESARLRFLTEQRDDLVRARDDLRSAIREINQTATRLFLETFHAIRDRFRETFHHLFEGGECDLWLSDPDDPLESVIEIHASPVGKKTQRIDLLSGGERALTALSLLFGIYLVKPSPFCVLDEVDAPLDEANIGRFIRLLQEFKGQTQFVVITHNPRTIEAADWIYGVTMEEPGVSSIVGVQLDEALHASAGGA